VHGAGTEDLRLDLTRVDVDLLRFEEAIARQDWAAAAALYGGAFLDGIYLDGDAGDFERWVDTRRARAQAGAERAFEQLAVAADTRGDHATAVGWWRRLTDIDPLRTRAAAGMIRALAASGDRSGAIRFAEGYAARVRDELDAEPNPHIAELSARLRAEGGSVPPVDDGADRIGGRYVLQRELGRGGMAVVSLARDLRHDRDVAVKMLHPELGEAIDRDRMLREIRVTARLQHPHVLPLYDSGEHDGQLYYVMPYVAGESLRARLQRDVTLPVPVAVRFAIHVADALDHAHQHGIVHRDVKPENILLTGATRDSESHAIVADFGIVQLVATAADERLTRPFFAVGTPAYMSPEQILAEGPVDARTDVYALGCVLFEMLTGRPPWMAQDAASLLARVVMSEPPSLRQLAPAVPPAVIRIVEQAIRREPDERFSTAAALARALERAIDSGPASPEAAADLVLPPLPPSRALIGRSRERETALSLLLRDDVRLVTLTGAGGSGKTALAEAIAHDAVAAFEGVAIIDLSAVTEAARVVPAIASALAVRDREQQGTADALTAALRGRRTLLVLDNLEQVVSAAADLARLLAAVPTLRLLVTSRIRLRLRGEYEFHVAPLATPADSATRSADELAAVPAVALFLQRTAEAGGAVPTDAAGLRAAAALCLRLDGLPLALELAAARTRLLSPAAILARLDARGLDVLGDGAQDLPARQRTLRATIGWSVDLLRAPARAALAHLAVFAGPFELEAAMAVLAVDEDTGLAWLQELQEANLLRRVDDGAGGLRLTLLETIRAFARDAAEALSVAATAADRHAGYFLGQATQEGGRLAGAEQAGALARLERDRAEFLRALEQAAGASGAGASARFTGLITALWRGWLVAGHWTDAREWIERAIAATTDPAALAGLLMASATIAQNQGDNEDAAERVTRALALWRGLGDTAGQARALASLGWLEWRRGRFVESRRLSAEALQLFEVVGDPAGIALARNNLGWIALFDGQPDAAFHLDEAIAIRRRLGDRRNIAFSLTVRARADALQGAYAEALRRLDEADALYADIGERQLLAYARHIRGETLLRQGAPAAAYPILVEDALPVFRRIGDRYGIQATLAFIGDCHREAGAWDDALAAYDECEAIVSAMHDGHARAQLLARRASLALARGAPDDARRCAKAATRAAAALTSRLPEWLTAGWPAEWLGVEESAAGVLG
jgi:non-specific serine/threonine protein kinase